MRDEIIEHGRRLEALVREGRNAIVRASAGTGKTYSLVATVVHLLAGLGRGRAPVIPGRICAITFTEKAAAEMQSRVRDKVASLAEDPAGDALLCGSAEASGLPLPDAEHWRRVHRDLGAMAITTFHGFCAQILREYPVEAGVEPGFGLADELLSETLLSETVENVIYERLARGDGACLRALRVLPIRDGAHGAALIDFVGKVLRRMREDGLSAEALIARHPRPEPEVLAAEHRRRLHELKTQRAILLGLWGKLDPKAMARGGPADRALLADLRAFAAQAEGLAAEVEALAPEALGDHLDAVVRYVRPIRKRARQAQILGRSRQFQIFSLPTFQDQYLEKMLQHAAVLLRSDFLDILQEVERRYSKRKRSMGVVDFTDLLILARDTLRGALEVRRNLKRRFEMLLVDEFQDTNDVQLDIVVMLGEAIGDEVGVRAGEQALDKVTLAPDRLFLVGDPKQSIYNFRGADVAVYLSVTERLCKELKVASSHALQVNRRSLPGLIAFGNRWFKEVLGIKDLGDEVATVRFELDDVLIAHREGDQGPSVEYLAVAPKSPPEVEAAAVARWIELQVQGGRRWGDVAILMRQFRNLSAFQDALQRRQIPYFVVKGRGFYGCPEIRDLHQALKLLIDPEDGIALVAVLRSPLFLISDEGLIWLQRLSRGRERKPLSLQAVLEVEAGAKEGISEADLEGLGAFAAITRRLMAEADRLGPGGLLESLVELTRYREKLAGTFRGRQKIGNVEKLIELAEAYERSTHGHLWGFERRLSGLIEREPREPEGQVVEESADVVRIMTVHQSKGLEFPLVVVPELHAMTGRRLSSEPVIYERGHGLQARMRVRHMGQPLADLKTESYDALREAAKAREDAEERRLVYVALTRARDRAWLSGQGMALGEDGGRSEVLKENPLTTLQTLVALDDPVILAHSRERFLGELMAPGVGAEVASSRSIDGEATGATEGSSGWEAAMARSFGHGEAPARSCPTVAVTQLGDLHRCPHRYYLWYIEGLRDEDRGADDAREWDQAGSEGSVAILDQGTVAHAALERLDFDLYERSSAAGRARLLREQLHAHDIWMGEGEIAEVTSALAGFLNESGSLSMLAAAQRQGRLAREVPFLVRVGDDRAAVTLRGQIDLVVQDEGGGCAVLDYKFSRRPAEGLGPHLFQLKTYALAAQMLFGRGGEGWSGGVVFLKEPGAGIEFVHGDLDDLEEFRGGLPGLARRLAEGRQGHRWPRQTHEGRPRTLEMCEAEGCAFRGRCFGQGRGEVCAPPRDPLV